MRYALVLLAALALATTVQLGNVRAEIKTKTIEYKDGDVALEGFVAWDPARSAQAAPGVLVVHQWLGLTDYEKSRCQQLAELGYVAFALDIYGKGVRPKNPQEAAKLSSEYKQDRELYRRRLNLGLEQLRAQPGVAKEQIAAIGYCFGGTGVLELARSGADIKGVVSFHGGLATPNKDDAKNIKARVLVLHGADDTFESPEELAGFEKEMRDAKVDWEMVYYSGAVHAFTNPKAGNDNSKGTAYNEKADKRSWQAMLDFFKEIF